MEISGGDSIVISNYDRSEKKNADDNLRPSWRNSTLLTNIEWSRHSKSSQELKLKKNETQFHDHRTERILIRT